jgi:hypothetical protein
MPTKLYSLTDCVGAKLDIPLKPCDDFEYFAPDSNEIKPYYDENGYVVIRG